MHADWDVAARTPTVARGGSRPTAVWAVALLALGCDGQLGGGSKLGAEGPGASAPGAAGGQGAGIGPAANCGVKSPGSSPIRRLTRLEYDNTVRDLLGDSSGPARNFAPEEQARGFNNNAEVLGVTALLAEQYKGAAASLAKLATDNLTGPNTIILGDTQF